MATAADPAADRESALYVAERLLVTAREDVARADTKAAVLLSGALAMPALLLSGRWSPTRSQGAWLVVLVLGAVLWAGGTALLVWTLLPRTRTVRPGPGLTFFGDTRGVPDPHALVRAVTEAGRDRVGWLMTQFVDISAILTAKYRCLRWGVCLLAPGLVLCGTSLAATA
ncbi:MAG TPA: Pycsar system effector family protein [Streptomyces sp.]